MSEIILFADIKTLLLGAFTGFVFGFLLQKGRVTKFNTIVNQFLLRDFTVLKVMFTAIVVGSIGIYGALALGIEVALSIKNATLVGNFVGGAIFAAGMVTLGYCPGTGVAAIGDGAKDAIFGILGMILGAAIYSELHSWFKANLLATDLGKVTLASVTDASPWWFIVGLAVVAVLGFIKLEKWEATKSNAN